MIKESGVLNMDSPLPPHQVCLVTVELTQLFSLFCKYPIYHIRLSVELRVNHMRKLVTCHKHFLRPGQGQPYPE